MTKRTWMACLAAVALCSDAAAITFTDGGQFDVTAVAVSDGLPGFDTQSSPALPAPVSAAADSVGTTDIASAGAIGGPGLLTTSADVSGNGSGVASAVSTSHFAGSFLMSAAEPVLHVDFTPLDLAVGSGSAATSLFITLTSGGITLLQDIITGPWELNHTFAPNTTGMLDLTLTSEATAGFLTQASGNAAGFGLVTFASAVPLPATWLLFLCGLGPIAALRMRATRVALRAG